MNRRTFLESLARAMLAVTVPGSLSAACSAGPGRAVEEDDAIPGPRDHLALGLNAMARSDGWFDAHWGAATIAARYLCDEAGLDDDLRREIERQLDTMIDLQSPRFAATGDEPVDPTAIEALTRALPAALEGGLRHSGHAPIYVALAVRALRDRPDHARPAIVSGIEGHIESMSRMRPKRADGDTVAYEDARAMVRATFESIARFTPLVGFPTVKRPNFTHMLTHTDSLVTLEKLGFAELARKGHVGHRAHISPSVPDVTDADRRAAKDAPGTSVLEPGFWQDEERNAIWTESWHRSKNPNGDWIASGHLFKILYAFERLSPLVDDDELVERVGIVAFERYLNPAVRGG